MGPKKKKEEEPIVRENQFVDEDENDEAKKENMDADSDSDDFNPEGQPEKLTKKERRAKLKAEEAARKKEKLAARKKNFWGKGKTSKKASKFGRRMKTITTHTVDPATGMLITEDKQVPVSDDENNKEDIRPGGGSQEPTAAL